ncbi:MAG: glycosyl transferase, partial [Pseudomonadota bacterium]|nr:glycosyl transferase [Pseudomonadota bacterium]
MSNSRHPTVFFYVQHLLGIGHLRRAELLCRSFSNAGWRVTLATGGQFSDPLDVGGAKIVNLPALKIGDADFHQLVDDDGLA